MTSGYEREFCRLAHSYILAEKTGGAGMGM